MLELSGINYWAVAVVWLIYVGVGAYWYSPAGFGKLWARLSGVNHMKLPENEASQAITYVAVSAVFQAAILELVLNSLDVMTVPNAIIIAIVLWLGFTAATTVGNTLYQRLGWRFWWLNACYFLVVMVIGAVILTIWQ